MNKRQAKHLEELLVQVKAALMAQPAEIRWVEGVDLAACVWKHHYDAAPETPSLEFICDQCRRRGIAHVPAVRMKVVVVLRNPKFDLPIPEMFRAELYYGACRGCRARWCLVIYRWRKADEAAPPPNQRANQEPSRATH